VTAAAGRPGIRAGLADALARGFVAFLAMVAIGQVLAFLAWLVADTGVSAAAVARLGWMYFGAFHHVTIELDVTDLDLVAPNAAPGSTSLSIGIALLSITAVAVMLLFRAGRRVADRAGGRAGARVLLGAAVAPAYALPAFVAALLVEVRTPIRFGAFATGDVHVALSPWQALVFPFAIAAASGAAGGFRSAFEGTPSEELRRIGAASAGAVRMLVVGLWLSLAGLFVAGVAQPDEPVALLTPSTAQYFETVFGRPAAGLVILGHHLAVAPNEAMWTIVPAMGACDGVRGSATVDFLCYARFPVLLEAGVPAIEGLSGVALPFGSVVFRRAPTAYLVFLLVPAAATLIGGRLAGRRFGASRRERALLGVTSGAMFALLVGIMSVLSGITIGYGAAFGGDGSSGWIIVGPNVVTGTLSALAWGSVGGALGAAISDLPRGAPS
jgi:uncharacterized protein DUF6350